MKKCGGRGFTLIELLVTLSLVVLVGAAVMSVLAGGLHVWDRLQGQWMVEEQLQIMLESVRRDLHNAQAFKSIPYEGSYDLFSFPSLVESPTTAGGTIKEIGRVGFYWDSGLQRLCRSKHPYRIVRSRSVKEAAAPLIEGVRRFRFSYCAPDPVTGEYGWKDSWSGEKPPIAVKMEIQYAESKSAPEIKRSLVVYLPTAPIR